MSEEKQTKPVEWDEIAGKPIYPKDGLEAIFKADEKPITDGRSYTISDEGGQTWQLWFTQIKPIANAFIKGAKRVHVKFETDPTNPRNTITTVLGAK